MQIYKNYLNIKIEILTLCEYASEHNGHITIVDTFDAISANRFPWRAYFSVASKIDINEIKEEFKNVTLKIISNKDQNKVIFEAISSLFLPDEKRKINIVANFKVLIFEEPGDYMLIILFDNKIIAECSFKVIQKQDE